MISAQQAGRPWDLSKMCAIELSEAQALQAPPSGQVWKSYYFTGSARIAMRVQVNGTADQVNYLLTDHLGSTTVSYRSDGGEMRYQCSYQLPFWPSK